jgi:hypothetical protein
LVKLSLLIHWAEIKLYRSIKMKNKLIATLLTLSLVLTLTACGDEVTPEAPENNEPDFPDFARAAIGDEEVIPLDPPPDNNTTPTIDPPSNEDEPQTQDLNSTVFTTLFGDIATVIYDDSIINEEEALTFVESAVIILSLINGNIEITDIDSWIEPWADIFGERELNAVTQLNVIETSDGIVSEVRVQVIASCIFDADNSETDVIVEYVYVDGIMGGHTFAIGSYGEGNFVFNDVNTTS